MELQIRHLRALCAVAETGSLNRAAAGLGLPQPALSRQIRRVERLLGGALFDRGATGARPTAYGTAVLEQARTILALLDDTAGELGRLRADAPGVVRVGWTSSALSGALMDWGEVQKPERRVQFVVADTSTELLGMLRTGELDAAVRVAGADCALLHTDDLAELALAESAMQVAVADDHPLARRDAVSMADLAGQEWISSSGRDNCMEWLRRTCRPYGFDPTITYDIPVTGPRPDVIRGNRCVSFVQSSLPPAEGVRHLPVADLGGRIRHSLVFRRRSSFTRHAPALARALGRAAEDISGITPLTSAPYLAT
ncbi:LysR family transcriptional regulator [Streptomyces sp. NPDC018031]|uniref:LysR family transcriptional regulator n=1 Tax=Streptomyces sp. NPDC018031 TaxID=3365033 RepID=UPI0037989573